MVGLGSSVAAQCGQRTGPAFQIKGIHVVSEAEYDVVALDCCTNHMQLIAIYQLIDLFNFMLFVIVCKFFLLLNFCSNHLLR